MPGCALYKRMPTHVYRGAGARGTSAVSLRAWFLSKSAASDVWDQRVLARERVPAWPDAKLNTELSVWRDALDAMYRRRMLMAKDNLDASIVHCHTWYVQFGGFMAKKLWGTAFVLTTHSLEPLRPWKVERLGNAYGLGLDREQRHHPG